MYSCDPNYKNQIKQIEACQEGSYHNNGFPSYNFLFLFSQIVSNWDPPLEKHLYHLGPLPPSQSHSIDWIENQVAGQSS